MDEYYNDDCFFFKEDELMGHIPIRHCHYYPLVNLYLDCRCLNCSKFISKEDAVNVLKKFVDER